MKPSARDVRMAVELFESFREKRPKRIDTLRVSIPRMVVHIGYLEAIDYRTTHGKELALYRHEFAQGSRPLLAIGADGTQLLILGGRYHFTERGIVDKDAKGKEIENKKHGKKL